MLAWTMTAIILNTHVFRVNLYHARTVCLFHKQHACPYGLRRALLVDSEFNCSIRHDGINSRNHGIEFGLYTRWKLANVHRVYLVCRHGEECPQAPDSHRTSTLIERQSSSLGQLPATNLHFRSLSITYGTSTSSSVLSSTVISNITFF